jgi:uncharacterized protein
MECQRFHGDRTLMRIHIGESDKWHGKLPHETIIELFRQQGLYGAPVLRGVGGYGSSSRYQTVKILRLAEDLPVIIEGVEDSERIERILPSAASSWIGHGNETSLSHHVTPRQMTSEVEPFL